MRSYLTRVAARALGVAPVLRPRGASRFEASPLDPVSPAGFAPARSSPISDAVFEARPARAPADAVPDASLEDAGDEARERSGSRARPPGARSLTSPRPARRPAGAETNEVVTPLEPKSDRAVPAAPTDDASDRGPAADDRPRGAPVVESRDGARPAIEVRRAEVRGEEAGTATPPPVEDKHAAPGDVLPVAREEPAPRTPGSPRSSETRALAARSKPTDAVHDLVVEAVSRHAPKSPPTEEGAAPVARAAPRVDGDRSDPPRARPGRAVVEIPSRAAVPRSADVSAPAPEVRVTIGRIEVTAAAPPSPPPPPRREPTPAPGPPRLSLDEYLERRNGAKT